MSNTDNAPVPSRMPVKRPTKLSEVRDGLAQMYADVMNDPRRAAQVHEGANALGKVIAACKVHVEFCALGRRPPAKDWSAFMEG